MTLAVLVIAFMFNGHLSVSSYVYDTMDQCGEVAEVIAPNAPDGARVFCIQVRDRDVT